ncbi:MAG: allantoicase [Elusimicrobia bacterium]|nr:allantoicase [Elusimicrobiota bacterium]
MNLPDKLSPLKNFLELPDLASTRLGGRALYANDEFFAPKENLLRQEKPIFIEGKYTHRGKWMDGWETRRRRTPGHDWCLISLGLRGMIRGFNVDTSYFVGNYPERCSIEAIDLPENPARKKLLNRNLQWRELLPQSTLKGGGDNFFNISSAPPCTHLRFHIYPDGGVARLRAHGEVVPDWKRLPKSGRPLNLAAIENGAVAVAASDMFFGSRNNLLMPGRAKNMGDGWETKRRRSPGYDWVAIRLGAPGLIQKIEVDTNHFKGNYPDRCSIEGANKVENGDSWQEILSQTKLKAHTRHFFAKELKARGPFSHVRLNIFPDGGVSRLRIYGKPKFF